MVLEKIFLIGQSQTTIYSDYISCMIGTK